MTHPRTTDRIYNTKASRTRQQQKEIESLLEKVVDTQEELIDMVDYFFAVLQETRAKGATWAEIGELWDVPPAVARFRVLRTHKLGWLRN